jgi:flagellar biosynthesis protein FlhB
MASEKTEKPTPRKLKKAREKGEVFKSMDVTRSVEFAVLLVMGWLLVVLYLPPLGSLFDAWPVLFERLFAAGEAGAGQKVLDAALDHGIHVWLLAVAPIVGASVFVGLLVTALQVRGVLSIEPLRPKAEHFDPATNLKRLVATRNLFEVAKTLVKVLVVGLAVLLSVRAAIPQWLQLVAAGSATQVAAALGRTLVQMGLACLALYLFMAGVDYGHQFYEYIKQQRMSKEEVQREYKEIEGDPYVKGHRRSLAIMLSREGPTKQLGQAKVVLTNPTHLSVAIGYDVNSGSLPSVVAKGAGPAAMQIREQARRLGIPLIENKPLARRLYGNVGVGAYITADSFADVARVLAGVPGVHRPVGPSVQRV